MTPAAGEASSDAGSVRATMVCTACSLLCDDVVPLGDVLAGACTPGQAGWRAAVRARAAAVAGPRAWVDGRAVSRSDALDQAALALGAARRVLVTGLTDGAIDTIAAACDLAEVLGAAIDPGDAEAACPAGPVVARIGRITADWDELRDRAALVVFWFCDPPATHPRFVERFVAPVPVGGARRTIAVGPAGVLPASASHAHVPLAAEAAVTAARALQGLVLGPPTAADIPAALATLLEPVRRAIDATTCAAFVTRAVDDPVGLAAWSTAALVRSLALNKPVFEVPLDRGVDGGADAAGAAAVCTWRYGAAGALARADRVGAVFRPAEADAVRLVARGEVDAVVAAGSLSTPLEEAIAARGAGLTVVRLLTSGLPTEFVAPGAVGQASGARDARARDARGQAPVTVGQASGAKEVRLRVASPLLAAPGTMLRGDGRWMELSGGGLADSPESPTAVLQSLSERLQGAGGRRPRHSGGPA